MGDLAALDPRLRELEGTILEDRYELGDIVGAGGAGVVFRGRHAGLDRAVAIKVLHPDSAAGDEARFQREAEAAARLDHPNCVHVYESGSTNGLSYLVMEFLEGRSLEERIDEPRTPEDVAKLALQTLRGLAHAHAKRLIHRDVKPGNLFLIPNADGSDAVKIVDFGLAKVVDSKRRKGSEVTMTALLAGTPAYMSPEQALGLPADPRTDLYSLGIVLYRLLVGELPFVNDDPVAQLRRHINEDVPKLPPSVPALLAHVVHRLCEKERAARYPNAAEAIADLERALRNPMSVRTGDTVVARSTEYSLQGPSLAAPTERPPVTHDTLPPDMSDDAETEIYLGGDRSGEHPLVGLPPAGPPAAATPAAATPAVASPPPGALGADAALPDPAVAGIFHDDEPFGTVPGTGGKTRVILAAAALIGAVALTVGIWQLGSQSGPRSEPQAQVVAEAAAVVPTPPKTPPTNVVGKPTVEPPSPDKGRGVHLLASVNDSERARRLGFERRHAFLDELGADAKLGPMVDARLNLALDLAQAGEAQRPCAVLRGALEQVAADPDPYYLDAIQTTRVPSVATAGVAPDQSCEGLSQQLVELRARLLPAKRRPKRRARARIRRPRAKPPPVAVPAAEPAAPSPPSSSKPAWEKRGSEVKNPYE